MTFRKSSRALLTGTSALALAFAGSILVAGPASAAPLAANDEASLITAINTANGDTALDVITLGANITLLNDLPTITESLTVVGAGFTINAGGYSAFIVNPTVPNIDTTFTNVTVTDADYGINAQGSNVTITSSAFDDARVRATGVGVTVTVSGSSFDNSQFGHGLDIRVNDTSVVTITGSSADNNDTDGIYLESDGSDVTMTGTTADDNVEYGVRVLAESNSTVTFTGGAADANGEDGMDFELEDSTLDLSTTSGTSNLGSGIDIFGDDGSTITVSAVEVHDNDNEGLDINVDDSSEATVADSNASGNGDDGFDADTDDADSSVSYTNCVSTNNDSAGFDFSMEAGTVTGSGLTATGNEVAGLDIRAYTTSSVTVSDSSFTGTTDGHGAFIEPLGASTVTLQRVTVTGNDGGGVEVYDDESPEDGAVIVADSTVADNYGSGFDVFTSWNTSLVISGTTISGNDSGDGAGIYAELDDESSITLRNSTISGNTQTANGAVFVTNDSDDTASLNISHSTIVNNSSSDASEAGGLQIAVVTYSIQHSIIAGNTSDGAPSDLRFDSGDLPTGSITYSLVQNSISDALTAVDAGTGNLKNTDPMLDPLADNGGTTLTHLPQNGSPVIDAGNPAFSGGPAQDQRGNTRVVGIIDLGAVESPFTLAATGTDVTLPIAGGVLAIGLGVLLLLARHRRLLAR